MSNEEQMGNVPKLRFPGFTGEWELVQLKDISVPVTEKVGKRKLTPVSISAGIGFVPQAEKFGRDISGNQYELYTLVRDGEFVFNKGNSKTFPQGCVYLLEGWGEVAAPNVFISFRLKDGYVNGFFRYLFEKNAHGIELKPHITSGARSNGLLNISKETFFGIRLPVASEAEQTRIAEALASLDAVISAHTDRMAALQTHKQGLMQHLFPTEGDRVPRLRFPEFEGRGEWEEERLEKLAKRGSGHTPSKSKPEYYNGGIEWVSLADSKNLDAGLINQTENKISDLGIRNSSAVLHPEGTVLISRDAGVGKVAIMGAAMAVSQHFITWSCNPTKLDNWFLYHTLYRMKPLFENIATGSTIKTIGLPFFIDLKISLPSLPEQIRIAKALSSLDDLISAQSDHIAALKHFKQGLMQGLFPAGGEG